MLLNKFDYEAFKTYLKVSLCKSPTTAKSIARDVELYLKKVEGSNCDAMKLLSSKT